ncbi:ash family protein [Rouxiella badensis]|uniref:ash family protein n=1 Tax=Rouxiella badensis TaxID=1646377 RepID=UPI001D143BC6|nr:ash family protein [Rouxiella badensis]MCC3732018.1 ash family protein [Rouxiella badensis]MCC3757407.1 ash family protein [Rouxiella badensis]
MEYSGCAAAKSAAGIDVLALTTVPKRMIYWAASGHTSMVAQAGASKGAPGSVVTGYVNPVWATTQEIDVSVGSFLLLTTEVA